MDKRSEQQAVKDCLATPGAKILAEKLQAASAAALAKYDRCKPEELPKLQIMRWLINEEFPRIIEGIVNPAEEPKEKRFNWRKLVGLTKE